MKTKTSFANENIQPRHSAKRAGARSTEKPRGLGITPRLLSRHQAAAYCGISAQAFSAWVRTGRLPPPIAGTCRWDLKAIDAALDSASGLSKSNSSSPLDEWRATRARAS
jgi:predicted DNA-binding transcriptional regulator AlpA